MKNINLITFVVLTYNHESYVAVHLESIAALVRNYNQIKLHDLVISDDGSQDNTVLEVSKWLVENRQIFRNVDTYFNSKNVGTCKSFLRATANIRTGFVKATGGDDLFSDQDIFSELKKLEKSDIIGSQPITLIEDEFYRFSYFNILHAASNAVYAKKHFRQLLVREFAIYTPGLIYSANLIRDNRVREFIGQFELVEDLPCWIAISEYYPLVKYHVSNLHLVYYRRTKMSAYLICKGQVFNDQLKCWQYLFDKEPNAFSRFLIGNKIWVMSKCPNQIKVICNVGKLIFCLQLLFKTFKLILNLKLIYVDQEIHKKNYIRIKEKVAHLRTFR